MASDDDLVAYRRRDGRRINRVVRTVEGAAGPVAGASGGRPWTYGVQRARVTVAIPTGTESSPSSTGKIKLKIKDSTGSWVDGDEFQVWNDHKYAEDVPVGRMIKVAWIAGDWWVVSGSCS